jgi:hypothetical protein
MRVALLRVMLRKIANRISRVTGETFTCGITILYTQEYEELIERSQSKNNIKCVQYSNFSCWMPNSGHGVIFLVSKMSKW